ncbi:MAG: hypothetical protein H0W72_15705, partial [Planctomycetes bacterium]|nr:hypothetical protein [Planctomycetota bacterium]
ALVITPEATIAVAPSARRGHARVDGAWFRWDDGSFLYPIAYNIRSPVDTVDARFGAFPRPDAAMGSLVMEGFIARLAAARINVGRVWMSPWFGGLEWHQQHAGYHGLGRYNLQNAWRLDQLFACAARHGILLELALWHHGPFTRAYDSQWKENPYNQAHGGPLSQPGEVMTDPEALRLAADRLRYIAARWGADPALFAWTLWIESDAVAKPEPTIAWHRAAVEVLKRCDSGEHIISTEFCATPGVEALWRSPDIGYVQMGGYSHADGLIRTFTKRAADLQYGKPLVIEEYGGHSQGGGLRWTAHELHDGPWVGWMLPFAGTPMPWWWNLVFAHGLERHHHRFADYIAGEDLRTTSWRYERPIVEGAPGLAALARVSSERAFAWIHAPAISDLRPSDRSWDNSADKAEQLYVERVGAFDPTATTSTALFPEVAGARLRLDGLGLRPGRWRAEFWDTWSTAAPAQVELTIAETGDQALALPALSRDVAIKLVALP